MDDGLVIPRAFREMPRFWHRDQQWLADLPRIVDEQCRRWGLQVTGAPWHGSNALVLPVVRSGAELALRLNPPGDEVARHADALRFWAGRGTVLLVEADPQAGAMLLERLGTESLRDRAVDEAMVVLGRMMRRLAVPAPASAPSTADIVRARAERLPAEWHRLGRPSTRASSPRHCGSPTAWPTRAATSRSTPTCTATRCCAQTAKSGSVREADLARDRARDWAVFRTVDYWLWGLRAGLTEDPVRCRRLAAAFLA